ncbi:MAG TPA: PepSY domain-containing protein, partial [Burkholderiaceae bacterium]
MGMLRRVWFQIHWFIGITAGTVLVVIGLTGATLSFRAEIVDAMNPGLRRVAPPPGAHRLTPAELMDRVQAQSPRHRVANIRVFSEPGRPVRIGFAPAPGE